MKNFKMDKYINTLGGLRKAAGVTYFVCWFIVTIVGMQFVESINETMVRFFLGPIGAALLAYYLKQRQYRSMSVRLNKNEKISWEPMAYGLFLLPIFLTLICVLSFFFGIFQSLIWIPTALLVNVGVQYAFFNVFGRD